MDFKFYPPNSCVNQYTDWTKAIAERKQADPFCCTPEWQMAFHDAFSPKRRLLIETAADSAIAFAEVITSPEEIFLTPIEAHWFFGSPLLGKNAIELLAKNLPEIEKFYKPIFPKILISGIRPDGDFPHRLIRALGNHFDFYLQSSGVQGSAALDGGVDGFLSRRSGNHRKKLKKQSRRARAIDVHFERVSPLSPEEAKKTYSRMLAVELTSWKGIGKCGMAEPPAIEFYDSMLQRLTASHRGRVIFARHEDKDIGFIFGGMSGDTYRGQQFSYNDQWKQYSIGNLMQMEQIAWLCEEGASRYDMGPILGPRMNYKRHWTEKEIPIETWILVKKTRQTASSSISVTPY